MRLPEMEPSPLGKGAARHAKTKSGWPRPGACLWLAAISFCASLPAQTALPNEERIPLEDTAREGPLNPMGLAFRPLTTLRGMIVEDADFMVTAAIDRRWARTRFSPELLHREFQRGTVTRDFFRTEAPLDGFNAERVGFVEGPLAVFHHTGTPIGFAHQLSRRALPNRRFGSVSLRQDHRGGLRLTTDLNQPLTPEGMALRVLGLYQDGPGFRRPSVNERRGLSLHWDWSPNKRNTLRLVSEYGEFNQVVPAGAILFDWYTPWIEAGRPLVDEPGQAVGAVPGVEWVSGGDYLVHIEGSSLPVMNWRRMSRGSPPLINERREIRKSFRPGDLPFGLSPYQSLTGRSNTFDRRFGALAGFWEYVFGGWLSTETAARLESGKTERFEGLRESDHALQVDVNRFLPDGSPNPFVGRPYLETTALSQKYGYAWTSLQARNTGTLRFKADYPENLPGQLEVGWFLGLAHLSSQARWENEVNLTPFGATQGLNHPAQRIRRRFYLDLDDGAPAGFSSAFAPIDQDGVRSAFLPVGNAPQRHEEWLLTSMVSLRGRWFDDKLGLTYGLGSDRSRVREGRFERDEQGVWPEPWEAHAHTLHTFEKARRTFGVSYAPSSASLLHYTRAKSFLPPRSAQRDVFGRRVPPQEVESHEIGLSLAFADDRLFANLSVFELTRFNQPSGALRGQKANWVYAIWEELDPPRAADRLAWVDLLDTRGRGFEFDLVFQPNRNWRIAWNIAQDRRRVHEVMPRFALYLQEHLPLWEARADVPVNSPRGDNVGELTEAIVDDFALERAQIGSRLLRDRDWQSQLSASYRFPRESSLDGWSLGQDLRWLGRAIIGFAEGAADRPDPARPFYGSPEWNLNAWIAHTRRIGRSTHWTVRMQVNNLLDDRSEAEFAAIDDGTGTGIPTRLATRAPRSLFLTNSLRF